MEAPTFINPLVEVKQSPVAGLGLFATVDLKKGAKICDYQGIEMSLRDFKTIYGADLRYTYCKRRMNKIIVGKTEPYLRGNPSHYANEALDPNILLIGGGLYTLRSVSAGEELFLQYPQDYPRDYVLTHT